MTDIACVGCGADMARNGTRSVRYADLVEGVGQLMSATIQRYSCHSCCMMDEGSGPRLKPGYRMTPDLFNRVGIEASMSRYDAVGIRHGLDRKTVRSVWLDWIAERRRIGSRPAECLLQTINIGNQSVLVAVNVEGRVLAVFSDVDDPMFKHWLQPASGGYAHADVAIAQKLMTQGIAEPVIRIRRADTIAWMATQTVEALDRAKSWLDRTERKAFTECRSIVIKESILRLEDEDETMRALSRTHARIRDLDVTLAGMRRVWATADHHVALERYQTWKASRSAFAKDIFQKTIRILDQLETAIFHPDHTGHDRLFPDRRLRIPEDIANDGIDRFVGRLFAMNHDAVSSVVLNSEMFDAKNETSMVKLKVVKS